METVLLRVKRLYVAQQGRADLVLVLLLSAEVALRSEVLDECFGRSLTCRRLSSPEIAEWVQSTRPSVPPSLSLPNVTSLSTVQLRDALMALARLLGSGRSLSRS
eukprot:4029197-Pleurochrysis_carterae.AAC.1